MHGFAVLAEIKSVAPLAHPLVIMTVGDREKDIIDSYAASACSYIRKPVNFAKCCDILLIFELYWILGAGIPPTASLLRQCAFY